MGLFGKKGPITDRDSGSGSWAHPTPVAPEAVQPPANVDASAIRALPLAEGDPDYSSEMSAALGRAISGDRRGAEEALRALVDSPNVVDAWCARMELGTLLMGSESSADRTSGLGLLLRCLEAPFSDVVSNAAWNISEVLREYGSTEAFEGYVRLAVKLLNPLALCVEGERALAAGDRDRARQLWQSACDVVPRTQPLRTRAEVQLANQWLQSASADVRDWFTSARGSLPADAWVECIPIYRNPGAVFNVEAGSAAIATRYFPDCPTPCYFESESQSCPECGREPTNTLSAAAGSGDGIYPVLSLLGPDSEVVGALTLFKDGLDALGAVNYQTGEGTTLNATFGGLGSTLADLLSAAAPMVLGVLDVSDSLLVSDASRCLNDRDYTVDMNVPAGEYTVVAWVTVPITDYDDTPRPLALGAFSGPMHQAIADCVPGLDSERRHQLIDLMWGRPDMLVNSHMGNVRVQVAQINHDADEEAESPRAISWFLQLAEFDDAGTHDLLRSMEPWDESVLRQLLAQRGIMEPKLSWRVTAGSTSGLTKGAGAGTLTKTASGLGLPGPSESNPRLSAFPGVDPSLVSRAESGDIFAWNDLGYALVHDGHLEDGLAWLERSARAGVPWAMATYNWQSLLNDDVGRAVALFDEVEVTMEAFVQDTLGQGDVGAIAPGQLANARSNDALCRLVLGGPTGAALDVWSAGRWRGHVESKFHPAVVAYRGGDIDQAQQIAATLSEEELAEVSETLSEVIDESSGWFAAWCRDGLTILESQRPDVPAVPASSEARFCSECGTARPSGARFCISCGSGF